MCKRWMIVLFILAARIVEGANERWSWTGSLNFQRRGFQGAMLTDGRFIAIGGLGDENGYEIFDPSTGTWVRGSLPREGDHAIAILLPNGKVLYISTHSTFIFLYDPFTETWDTSAVFCPSFWGERMGATLLQDGTVLLMHDVGGNCALYYCDGDSIRGTAPTNRIHATGVEVLLPSGEVLVAGGGVSAEDRVSVEIYDPVGGIWSPADEMTYRRVGHVGVLLPSPWNKVLVAGRKGTNVPCELFDIDSKTWKTTGSLNRGGRGVGTMVLLPCGEPMIIGGWSENGTERSCERYNPDDETWEYTDSMKVPRHHSSSGILVTGKVLAVGCWAGVQPDDRGVEIYDPSEPSWETKGILLKARKAHTVTPLPIISTENCSTNVLIVGGEDGNGVALNSCELYNYAFKRTLFAGPLNEARTHHATILFPPDISPSKVITIGGKNSGGPIKSCEIYNIADDEWTFTDSMNTPRFDHTATLLGDGRILVTGGEGAGILNSCEIYSGDSWTEISPMSTRRTQHTAVLLLDGRVLVIGGRTPSGPTNKCEIWNGSNWESAPSLINARYLHTAIVLQSGKVLVIGGRNATGALSSCEIWDPNGEGNWEEEGKLNQARYAHNSILLYSGLVLTIGGYDGTNYLGSCEIWDPAAERDTIAEDIFVHKWKFSAELEVARAYHASVLIPTDRPYVFSIGGETNGPVNNRIDWWDVGLGYRKEWQSTINSHPSITEISSPMYIRGNLFRGVSEADGGNYCHIVSSDHPIMTLLRIGGGNWQGNGGGNVLYMPLSDSWSDKHTNIYPPVNLDGYYRIWAVVNGIPTKWYEECRIKIEEETEETNLGIIYELFPNPSLNGSIKLKIRNVKERMVIKIYDCTGRIAQRIVNNIGNKEIKIGNLRSGIYFYRIEGKTFTKKGKFIVL
jgi:N-acetylneuraminic acid mutarotase